MLQVGVPRPAVVLKMTEDQVNVDHIITFSFGPEGQPLESAHNQALTQTSSSTPFGTIMFSSHSPSLTFQLENELYIKYLLALVKDLGE